MSNPLIANISMLFSDLPMEQRFLKAAEYGFSQVEIQFPYDWPADTLKNWAEEAGVSVYLINISAGDLLAGGKSFSCHPEYATEFREACTQALHYGKALGVSKINVLASNLLPDDDRDLCLSTYIDNIRYAAELMMHDGIQVTFEAINQRDMPNYLMCSFEDMKAVYDSVMHPNALMQYDLYHMAAMNEPIKEQILEWGSLIGHIQFADFPGRGAPATGSLPLVDFFRCIGESAYAGCVSAEYRLSGDECIDYGWLRQ